MSGAASTAPKGVGTRIVQATMLVLLFALLWATTRAMPHSAGELGAIAALGFLLLVGTLASELLEPLGLPHLTGYILAGIIAGPHILHLLDHHTVERLGSVNNLALALISFAGGAELKLQMLRKDFRSLAWATLIQTLGVLFVMTAVFMALRPFVPFVRDLPLVALFGVGLLWGTLAVTRSPSALLGILSQTRASGPLTNFSLGFVMTSDIVVVVLLALVMGLVRPLVDPADAFSLDRLAVLGHELLGTVALGTTLGLCIALYMRLVGTQLVLIFVALGVGASEIIRYLDFEPMLAFMVAGFVVQNLSKQGEKFLHAVESTGGVVFVVFFATAGAHLDVPLVREMWPVALLLCAIRAATSFGAARLASRIANDIPVVRKWGWSSLVSQAGLALGVAAMIERAFPSFGPGFRALAVATVAMNEMVGPVLFKVALDRAGESAKDEQVRPSLEEEGEEVA